MNRWHPQAIRRAPVPPTSTGKVMHYRTFLPVATAFAVFASALAVSAAPAQAGKTVNGYSYQLHTSQHVQVDQLGNYPPDANRSPRVDRVLQAPEYTLMWRTAMRNKPTVDNASFALGKKSLGLFVPYWQAGRSASDETGWSDYGRTIYYSSFNVEVTRGKEDRNIAGGKAQHYVLTADFTESEGKRPTSQHITLHSNVWVLPDKPFSWAPYSRPAIYADPRLQVAVAERLGKLGMVVRSDTRHFRETVDQNGKPLDKPSRSSTWVAWVTDLKSAQVPVVDMPPVADRQTIDTLQDSFRKDASGTCKTILAGSTPAFIKDTLNAEQQPAVTANLRASCQRQIMRTMARQLKENAEPMCRQIMSGSTPAALNDGLSKAQQQEFLDYARPYCKKNVPEAGNAETSSSQSAQAADGEQCTSKQCFAQRFAQCNKATYTTASHMGGKARYAIQGGDQSGCRVSITYLANPNPAWVNKPLHVVLDPGEDFEPQMKQALQSCLVNHAAGAYQCSGPLHGVIAQD